MCGSPSEEQPTETWIFDIMTKSWEKLDVSGPKLRPGYVHSLVTLCNTTVLLVSVSSTQFPEVWAFNSEVVEWRKVKDDNSLINPSFALPVYGRFVTVSVPVFASSPTCSDAALAIAGNDSILTLWKLTLDDQNRTVWRKLKQNCDTECPSKIIIETAAVSKESGDLYVLGFGAAKEFSSAFMQDVAKRAVWSYSVLSERWVVAQLQPSHYSEPYINDMWQQCTEESCVASVGYDDVDSPENYIVYSRFSLDLPDR